MDYTSFAYTGVEKKFEYKIQILYNDLFSQI